VPAEILPVMHFLKQTFERWWITRQINRYSKESVSGEGEENIT
jgi:hypothetical protein